MRTRGCSLLAGFRGLKALFGSRVLWDVGDLMNFDALADQWRKATKPYVNKSTAKGALQLKFLLELEVELSSGTTETCFKQMVWIYDPNSIAGEFPGDWLRLAEHPLMLCRVNREPVSGKGRYQSLDLRNVRTLYPAYGQDRGSFVSTHKKETTSLCCGLQISPRLSRTGSSPKPQHRSFLLCFKRFSMRTTLRSKASPTKGSPAR